MHANVNDKGTVSATPARLELPFETQEDRSARDGATTMPLRSGAGADGADTSCAWSAGKMALQVGAHPIRHHGMRSRSFHRTGIWIPG